MSEDVTLAAGSQDFTGYLAKPEGEPRGGLIIIHEVWGLTDHIKDVADRFASQGYLALAPELIEHTGITGSALAQLQQDLFNPKTRNEAQPKLRQLMAPVSAPGFAGQTVDKLKTCFNYLSEKGLPVAVVGFCFGGSYSFSLAVNEPKLKAAVPFYGHADFSESELAKINCPVLAFYGRKDDNLVSSLSELESKMDSAGVDFASHVYEDCGHAFFNDTNKFAYNQAAATDAWDKTLKFLEKNL